MNIPTIENPFDRLLPPQFLNSCHHPITISLFLTWLDPFLFGLWTIGAAFDLWTPTAVLSPPKKCWHIDQVVIVVVPNVFDRSLDKPMVECCCSKCWSIQPSLLFSSYRRNVDQSTKTSSLTVRHLFFSSASAVATLISNCWISANAESTSPNLSWLRFSLFVNCQMIRFTTFHFFGKSARQDISVPEIGLCLE